MKALPQSPLSRWLKEQAWQAVTHMVSRHGWVSALELHCIECNKPAYGYDHYRGYLPADCLDVEPICRKCDGQRKRERSECNNCGRYKRMSDSDAQQMLEMTQQGISYCHIASLFNITPSGVSRILKRLRSRAI